MLELQGRLVRCFYAVFPEISANEICGANPVSVPRWDSLTTVTLFTVIKEEFGVNIEIDELESGISFEAIIEYLNKNLN